MSETIVRISDEIEVLDKLITKAHKEGDIPNYGTSGHHVIQETLGILKEEINGIKPQNATKGE